MDGPHGAVSRGHGGDREPDHAALAAARLTADDHAAAPPRRPHPTALLAARRPLRPGRPRRRPARPQADPRADRPPRGGAPPFRVGRTRPAAGRRGAAPRGGPLGPARARPGARVTATW